MIGISILLINFIIYHRIIKKIFFVFIFCNIIFLQYLCKWLKTRIVDYKKKQVESSNVPEGPRFGGVTMFGVQLYQYQIPNMLYVTLKINLHLHFSS